MSLLNDVLTFSGAGGDRRGVSRRMRTHASPGTGEDRAGAAVSRRFRSRRPNAPSSRVGQVKMSPKTFRRLLIGWAGAAATLLVLSLAMRWWLG
jgi:hypothetical protein